MANAIRALSMDAVEKAGCGHPGLPMGMADVATVLFTRALKYDSADPDWPDRDRFILSAGHGSMLLYALLWLTGTPGWKVSDLASFRQWGSKAAGHPEHVTTLGAGADDEFTARSTHGIETTTGPLGQGFGNGVGMAIAEAHLRAEFGAGLVDHFTYVLASDGDLMEGLSHEAAALAGHLKLNKLVVLYDDNLISIDGPTSLADSTDALKRFEAYGWRAERIDGHDGVAIAATLDRARTSDRPSLIACRTVIGFGAPKKQGNAAAHGAALGVEEVKAARATLGWTYPPFEIPEEILTAWRAAGRRGRAAYVEWEARLERAPSQARAELLRRLTGDLKPGLGAALARQRKALIEKPVAVSTRKASELALEIINAELPEVIGGSADLTGSNNTKTKGLPLLTAAAPIGRYLHYGVREHAMAAAMNGMALHGGVIPYGGTFLVFSDYCRPSIRLAALMKQRVVYVMTHDSIGLGEDGPTHQPIEHLAALRAIPHLLVLRPADAIETSECWEVALNRRDGPSLLALSRQDLPQVRLNAGRDNLSARGAYVLKAAQHKHQALLIATGSEVAIALEAQAILEREGIAASVVSMPCLALFDLQSADYRASVLPAGLPRIAIEAGLGLGWERVVGPQGAFIGLIGFGASAPYQTLYQKFGLTPQAVAAAVRERL
jgi:transketolase